MKVSVVLSSYNGEQDILEQLCSIDGQTRQPDEVLICDDCSTDGTVNLVQNYIEKKRLKNWKLVVNKQNKGWRKNFIDGILASTGDLIFTSDQDDIWREDKIEIMEKVMLEHSEINLLASNYREFYPDGKEKIGPNRNDKRLVQVKARNNFLLVDSPGCTHCFRRSLFDISYPYWFEKCPHDALMWRAALFSDSLYTLNDDLIRWRKHTDSAFSKEAEDLKNKRAKAEWIDLNLRVIDDLRKFVRVNNFKNKNNEKALERNERCFKLRQKFFSNSNILTGVKLIRYWNCYPRYRQYLGDWYLIFIKG